MIKMNNKIINLLKELDHIEFYLNQKRIDLYFNINNFEDKEYSEEVYEIMREIRWEEQIDLLLDGMSQYPFLPEQKKAIKENILFISFYHYDWQLKFVIILK